MSDKLLFDKENYEVKTCTLDGCTITYRAYTGIDYCENPVHRVQKLNIFAPECYYEGGSINGYDLNNAPIFMPNTVGGYMEGPAMEPGTDRFSGGPNTAFAALAHGYVVAAPGIRGRNTGEKTKEFFVGGQGGPAQEEAGELVGRAPAIAVDTKAAVRYLRHNKGLIPGDPEKIITNGTSAGGALSSMAGATGNSPDYEPYLEAIGAAKERDDIFAASCYCPIHNLENADAAYEWLFCGENDFHMMKFEMTDHGMERKPVDATMSDKLIALSPLLKAAFPAYVNSLDLKDDNGNALTFDENGEGSFAEYVKSFIMASAQKELDTHWSKAKDWLMVKGSDVEKQDYLKVENGKVTGIDWKGYVHSITRMKPTPAFDALDLHSPECVEFGDSKVYARHFTAFSQEHSEVESELASSDVVKLLNPTLYVGKADTAPHWRIRHGAYDRDTSIAIPVILATLLKNKGCDVDFFLPWGLPHSGDYDLDELFAWIDSICK